MKRLALMTTAAIGLTFASFAAQAATYSITVTNNLSEELLAPIVVTDTANDGHFFEGAYVTPEAEHQILTGDPKKVVARINAGMGMSDTMTDTMADTMTDTMADTNMTDTMADTGMAMTKNMVAVGHGNDGPPGVLLKAGDSVTFEFETDATSLRIVSMVAPTMFLDNYVSNVVDVHATDEVTVKLNRFDIGHDEGTMTNKRIGDDAATVVITRK